MKINTKSKKYASIRSAVDFASYFGGCFAFDSVMIPFTQAVMTGKLRVLRPFAYLGTYGLSVCVGAIAAGGVDWAIDTTVDFINSSKSNDIPEDPVSWYKETNSTKIDTKNATPNEEMELVNDFVAEAKIFEFDSEEDAKKAGEYLYDRVTGFGFWTIASYCQDIVDVSIYNKIPNKISDIIIKYGWDKDSFMRPAIERIPNESGNKDKWILDVFNYTDISEHYEIFRNREG